MSKINVCDLTISSEIGLVDLKDDSSILKSVYGGLLSFGGSTASDPASDLTAALRRIGEGLAATK